MKLACTVHGKPGLVVGYAQGKKNKIFAVVITEGQLKSVRLREIHLSNIPEALSGKPKLTIVPPLEATAE
jgi:hypothetical protein